MALLSTKWTTVVQLLRPKRRIFDLRGPPFVKLFNNYCFCSTQTKTKAPKAEKKLKIPKAEKELKIPKAEKELIFTPKAEKELKFKASDIKRLSRLLNLPKESIPALLLEKPRLGSLKIEVLQEYLDIFNKYNMGNALDKCPRLISIPPMSMENYILIYEESEIDYEDVFTILRFNILKNWSIHTLKEENILSPSANLVENYIKILKLDPLSPGLHQFLPDNTEKLTLRDLRLAVLAYYLSVTINISIDQARNIVNTKIRLSNRSFTWIARNMELLKTVLEIPDNLIGRHSYLLNVNPDRLLRVSEIPSLGGIELKVLAKAKPKLLMTKADNLLAIDKQLQDLKVSPDSILKTPEIFTLSPKTVEARVDNLNSIPELASLKLHPRILRIIFYHKRVLNRLQRVKDLDISGQQPNLNVLVGTELRFSRVVDQLYKKTACDSLLYLSRITGRTKDEVRQKLVLHPYWLLIPLTNVTEVVEYLLDFKSSITESAIFDALPIVLYPKEKIEGVIEEIIETQEALPTHTYFLHMVLYFLEKTTHFSGDGVWSSKLQEEDRLSSVETSLEEYEDEDFAVDLDFEDEEADLELPFDSMELEAELDKSP